MAALIDETYMRTTFNIHKDVASNRITPYINAASRRLKKWVGTARYTGSDADTLNLLKLVEATLVMHFLELNLNTNIRPKGLVATETVEGNVTVRYFNPVETAQFSEQYLDQADELIREFLDGDAADIEIVRDGDDCGQPIYESIDGISGGSAGTEFD